jgi:hypothetical protein
MLFLPLLPLLFLCACAFSLCDVDHAVGTGQLAASGLARIETMTRQHELLTAVQHPAAAWISPHLFATWPW